MRKMINFKRSITILLVLLSLTLFEPTLKAEAEEPAVLEARNSVVRIYQGVLVHLSGDQYDFLESTGTGFCVGKANHDVTHIVTNGHVVDVTANLEEIRNMGGVYRNAELIDVVTLILADNKAYEIDYVNNVTISQIADLAIIKLEETIPNRVPATLGNSEAVNATDTIYAIGYPAYSDVEDINNSITDSMVSQIVKEIPSGISNLSITKGQVVKTNVVAGGISHIQHDAAISNGSSGGPLVDRNGNVIGINTWTNSNGAASANFAIDIGNIITLLKQNNVEYKEADRLNRTTVIVLAVSVLAMLAITGVIIYRKTLTPKPVPTKEVIPIIRSLAPQHSNRKIKIGEKPVLIGRTEACSIVYADLTPGIGREHCEVRWDPEDKTFIVKDLNSKYGTFLENGMKMGANKPYKLKPGESFYLAEKTNMLHLEVEYK